MLEIKNLSVEIEGKKILTDLNVEVKKENINLLLGPNGSGKTSLTMTIMGMPGYEITNGEILLDGKKLNGKSIDERARMGLGISFQSPKAILGVKLKNLLKIAARREMGDEELKKLLKRVDLNEKFLDRDVNAGFSGGEQKRSEIAQLFAMKPKAMILDEIDSGVDVDSLKLIGTELSKFQKETGATVLIITHTGHILQYLKPDKAYVMIKGRIACSGKADSLWHDISTKGYGWCEKCLPS